MPAAAACPTPATPSAAGPAPASPAGATPPAAGPTLAPAAGSPPASAAAKASASKTSLTALWLLPAHAAAQPCLHCQPRPPSGAPAHARNGTQGRSATRTLQSLTQPGPRPDLAFALEERNVNAAAILDPCPPSVAPPR